jgi:diaminopimelate epimerase
VPGFDEVRPRSGRAWYKGHGIGNDYLVFEEGGVWTLTPGAVQRVCDRTRGAGGDGIVVLLVSLEGPFRLRMFNPDGGEFERSGNGLRVLASHLYRTGRVGIGAQFDVEVGGDHVRMEVHAVSEQGIYDISVEMGKASVDPADAGLATDELEGTSLVVPEVGLVKVQPVSVGNPHAVVFTDDLSDRALRRIGPGLATHAAFAHGTNVQMARPVRGERAVEALVWERGVGHTLASGTSACAVAVACVTTKRIPPGEIEVRMEGGNMSVSVSESLDVVLRGPVQEVCTGELTDRFVWWLRDSEKDED